MAITIPSIVFDTYFEGVTAMMESLGVDCTVYYPPKKTICSNCNFNPATNTSMNTYKSGGPVPFTNTICPYCQGIGFSESVESDTVKLRVYYDKKRWLKIPTELKVPEGSVQIYGYMDDLSKIRRANYIFLNTAQKENGFGPFRLAGDAVPHGLTKSKYFIAILERINAT